MTKFYIILTVLHFFAWQGFGNNDELSSDLKGFLERPGFYLYESWDFGDIADRGVVEHTFRFSNIRSDDLLILGIGSSCQCLSGAIGKFRLAKSESTEIKVILDTATLTGTGEEYLFVDTYDRDEETAIFRLNYRLKKPARPKLAFDPDKKDVGLVIAGREIGVTIRIGNKGDAELQIFAASFDNDNDFHWHSGPPNYPLRIQPGDYRSCEIAYSPRQPGPLHKVVHFKTNTDTDKVFTLTGYVASEAALREAVDGAGGGAD